MFSKLAYSVFEQSIKDYHQFDNVDQPISNPFPKDKFEHLLYHRNFRKNSHILNFFQFFASRGRKKEAAASAAASCVSLGFSPPL